MPAFLAPILGGAARVLGTRALGAGAARLGAGALSRSSIMSAAQFGASAAMMSGGSDEQASNQKPQSSPGPVQIG